MRFHNHYRSFVLIGLLLVGSAAGLQAQTKKKLKDEVKELKTANTQLRNENRKLKYEKEQADQEKKQIVDLTTFFENEVYRLRKDSAEYHAAYQAAVQKVTEQQAKKEENTYRADPNDSRVCAQKQASLKAGYSYFRDSFGRLNSKGWGVQVFTFSSLCQAQEKADEFAAKYHMWKTYIKVKEVNGEKVFAVVYGTLRDEQQARTYCENFKQIASGPEAKNAFLVQH